jgi:hypothetical protein
MGTIEPAQHIFLSGITCFAMGVSWDLFIEHEQVEPSRIDFPAQTAYNTFWNNCCKPSSRPLRVRDRCIIE